MASKSLVYVQHIKHLIDTVVETQYKKIDEVSSLMVETIKEGKCIYVFGASHAGIIAQEVFYRTGGLVPINPILPSSLMLNTRPVIHTSSMERLEGYGSEVLKTVNVQEGDLLLIHSVSGRNAVAIDMALDAKAKGVKVIALTNLTYSSQVTARHSSNKRLFECADIVIDNCGDFEDSCIQLENFDQKVAPTSTVVGALIVNMLVVQVAEKLLELGIDPPIYHSANVDGGDAFNQLMFEKYKNQIHYL